MALGLMLHHVVSQKVYSLPLYNLQLLAEKMQPRKLNLDMMPFEAKLFFRTDKMLLGSSEKRKEVESFQNIFL